MALLPEHQQYHDEMWAIPGFLTSPIRIIGVQEIFCEREQWPQLSWEGGSNPTLQQLFLSKGLVDVKEIDFHDPRAEMQWDLNKPIPGDWWGSAHTVLDIGSIEHISNSNQVLENYVRLVGKGGFVAVHTPVKGYCGHGLYTFSPEYITGTLELNGCKVLYLKFTCPGGVVPIVDNEIIRSIRRHPAEDILIWIVVQKVHQTAQFRPLQQVPEELK
jgi:hypothetical protein